MSDYRLNSRASFEELTQLGRKISPARDIDRNRFRMIVLSAKALINKRGLGPDARYPLDLGQRRFQGRSIIRIVMDGIDPDNPALPRGGYDGHFATKLVVLMNFPLRETLHLRSMDTIDLAVIGPLLGIDPVH